MYLSSNGKLYHPPKTTRMYEIRVIYNHFEIWIPEKKGMFGKELFKELFVSKLVIWSS